MMLREELKKIWKPGQVLILIFLGFIFYTMFLEFYIKYFPNGPYAMGIFQVSKQIVETYGTSLSFAEMEKVREELPGLYQEADRYIQEFDLAKQHGLKTYQDFIDFSDASLEAITGSNAADKNIDYADMMRIRNYLNSPETGNINGRIYGVESILQMYDAEQKIAESYRNNSIDIEKTEFSEREFEHIRKTFYSETKDWQNVLPTEVAETTARYFSYLLVWLCFSVCLLISPLLVYDQMSHIRAIQYSSKRGRGLLLVQLKAVMLSAFVLTIFHLLLFGGIFLTNGTKAFSLCNMYSFENVVYCWVNWTYGIWCLVLIGLSVLVAMGTAGIAFFLSKYSTNYIGMFLKLIPFFVVIAVLCPKLLYQAFYYNNSLYQITKVPYIEAITAGGILLIGIGLGIKTEKGGGNRKKE